MLRVLACLALVFAHLANARSQSLQVKNLVVEGEARHVTGPLYLFDAPADGNVYGRHSNSWVIVSGGGGPGGIPDAPADNRAYVRRNNIWVVPLWSYITNTPTTLAGYGITDGATDTELAAHASTTHGVHGITIWGAGLVNKTNASAARAHLELGNASTRNVGTNSNEVAAGNHTHSQYELAGVALTLLQAHEAASDPHSVYLTQPEGDALYYRLAGTNRATGAIILSNAAPWILLTEPDGPSNAKHAMFRHDDGKLYLSFRSDTLTNTYDVLTIDRATGTMFAQDARWNINGNLYRNNNRVWDAGNDGSGSGLDADLLDGHDSTYYLPAQALTNHISDLDPHPIYLTQAEGDARYIQLGQAGDGDMKRAVYDVNTNGVVDRAESVSWSGVTNRPTTLAGYGITDGVTKGEHAAHTNQTVGAHGISTFGASLIDDANAAAARATLGLGDASTRNVGTGANNVAAGDHLHDGRYLQITGGLLTGNLSIMRDDPRIILQDSGDDVSANQHRADLLMQGGVFYLRFYDDTGTNGYNVLTITRTGHVAQAININVAGSATILGNRIWHAGNDGASSGLDADLLDGQHGSYYLTRANHSGLQSATTIGTGSVSDTEFGYLDGLSGPIQGQLSSKAGTNHTHTISQVTGLQSALDGKEPAFSKGSLVAGPGVSLSGDLANRLVGSGNVTISVSGVGSGDMLKAVYDTDNDGVVDAAEAVAWAGVTGKPTTLAGYGITDGVTKGEFLAHTNQTAGAHGMTVFGASLVNDSSAAEARATLGLGDSATRNVGTGPNNVAAGNHLHDDRYLQLTGGTITGTLGFGSTARQMLNLWGDQYALGVQSATLYIRTADRFSVHAGGSHNNGENNPGTGGANLFTIEKDNPEAFVHGNKVWHDGNVQKGSIVAGSGVSITGNAANRLLGSGNITISVTEGSSGRIGHVSWRTTTGESVSSVVSSSGGVTVSRVGSDDPWSFRVSVPSSLGGGDYVVGLYARPDATGDDLGVYPSVERMGDSGASHVYRVKLANDWGNWPCPAQRWLFEVKSM